MVSRPLVRTVRQLTGADDVDHRAVGDRRDRALPRALPDDGPDPRVRGSDPVALPARRDLRDDAPLLRAGGGRGRHGERARGSRSRRRDVPRPRPRARARRRPAARARRDARPRHRRQRRTGRLDEHQLAEGPARRLVRDRRRNDRRCHRRRPRAQARRRRRRLPVRRRRDQPGLLLRVPQLLRGAAAPGRLPLREQRLRRVHAVPGRHRRRDPRAGRGDGGAGRDRRRDERGRGAGGSRSSGRPRPCRRRPGLPRGDHLPLRRALTQRPRRVPAGRRARRVEGARPDHAAPRRARRTPESIRRSSIRSTPTSRRSSPTWSAGGSRRRSRSPGPHRSSAGEPERPADAAPVGLDERGDDRRLVEAARRVASCAAIRWSRSRPTRRPSSTRPSRTGCSAEILVPEGGVAALGEPIARLAGGDGDDASAAVARPEAAVEAPPSARRLPRAGSGAGRRRRARASDACGAPDRRLARRLALRARRHGPGRPHPQAGRGAGRIIGARRGAGDARPQGTHDGRRAVDDGRDDRAPHDAVAVGDPVVRRRRAGRHVRDRPAPPRRGRPRGDGSVRERLRRQGRGAGAAGVPRVQQLVRRRTERAPRPGERRHRRGHGGCAAGARGRRRGQQAARRHRGRDARRSPRGRATGDSRSRSSRRRRSRSRTWACSTCARSPR